MTHIHWLGLDRRRRHRRGLASMRRLLRDYGGTLLAVVLGLIISAIVLVLLEVGLIPWS